MRHKSDSPSAIMYNMVSSSTPPIPVDPGPRSPINEWQQFPAADAARADSSPPSFHHRNTVDATSAMTQIELQPLGSETTLNENSQHLAHDRHGHHHHVRERVEEGIHELVHRVEHGLYMDEEGHHHRQTAWDRFKGQGRRKIGWLESLMNTARSSVLNILLLCIPPAWIVYFVNKSTKVDPEILFSLCFLSIVPLAKLLDFCGKQMMFYTGKRIGDLLLVTLNNLVEAMCGVVLLLKCELRILQATIVGIVLLHLLFVPGLLFFTGGRRVYQQELHGHYTQLNHTLLAIGVLSLLVPAAFFSAYDTGLETQDDLTNADTVKQFTQMSRVIALALLAVYVVSRIYLFRPPKDADPSIVENIKRSDMHEEEHHLRDKEPKVNSWFCLAFLAVTTVVTAVTVELLVTSVSKHARKEGGLSEEWIGLVLIPMVSFSADAFVAVVYFLRRIFFLKPKPPDTLAEDSAIDMSIQFTLFWMPILVLIGWWMDKSLLLLFDVYEVAVLIGATFLVNYVTADKRVNWAEGFIMMTYYFIITVCAWFYNGQSVIARLYDSCVKVSG